MSHQCNQAPGPPDFSSMSRDDLREWLLSEPPKVPLNSFPLHSDEGRQAFLREFYGVGYSALFEAVSHVWHSLAEPQAYRCTLMGLHSGAGGKGKKALWATLRQFVREALAINHPIPQRTDFATLEEWHQAAMATWDDDERDLKVLLVRYSQVLNGEAPDSPSAAGEDPPTVGFSCREWPMRAR